MALKEDFDHFHFHLSLYFLIKFSFQLLLIQAKASRDGNRNYPSSNDDCPGLRKTPHDWTDPKTVINLTVLPICTYPLTFIPQLP